MALDRLILPSSSSHLPGRSRLQEDQQQHPRGGGAPWEGGAAASGPVGHDPVLGVLAPAEGGEDGAAPARLPGHGGLYAPIREAQGLEHGFALVTSMFPPRFEPGATQIECLTVYHGAKRECCLLRGGTE